MEKWIIFFMLFFLLKALSQDTSEWVRIDCGSQFPTGTDVLFQTDEDFIKTGKNKQVSRDSNTAPEQLNTLRFFTEQNKNCYTLPTPTGSRYFFRAIFYYGNYDGLSKPPTFDLELDGNKWMTVVTSMTQPLYYEAIYTSKGDNTSVCLARTMEKQFPFISILEAWPLPVRMHAGMSRDLAWFRSYGYNYGATDWIRGYPDDDYNRIWEPIIPSGLDAVTASFTTTYYTTVDFPPDKAIIQAVQALEATDSIQLSFTITKHNPLNHVVMYYTEVDQDINATRSFDIYVNDKFVITATPEYQNCSGAWANAQSADTLTVELRPTEDSTLPPIISAIEVYTASDHLVNLQTSQNDLDGLAAFINNFEKLKGWSGDPCLPSDTVWQWLACTGKDPLRVTSINLSGYGLDGPLPDFSLMQALETIDLGNNSFKGPIPDFLGNLPNLKQLILRDNNFSGNIPQSITNNKRIKYDISGNPDLHQHKKKRVALIVGLAIGIPSALIILIIILICLLTRKQPKAKQEVTTTQDKPQEEIVPISMEESIEPAQDNEQKEKISTGKNNPASINNGTNDHPNMNMKERS